MEEKGKKRACVKKGLCELKGTKYNPISNDSFFLSFFLLLLQILNNKTMALNKEGEGTVLHTQEAQENQNQEMMAPKLNTLFFMRKILKMKEVF